MSPNGPGSRGFDGYASGREPADLHLPGSEGTTMGSSTDVFGALMWGLRKYAWVVLLPVLAIGVLVPLALSQSTPVYEAEAIVAPNKQVAAPSVDVLPRFGESAFSSDDGVVAGAVREAFEMPPDTVVIPRQVELVTEQDNVAMTVIGRSSDPERAALLANAAAVSFQLQLNQASDAVAYYIVLEAAEPPAAAEPQLSGGTTSVIIGVLGGLIVGLALVVLLVVLRRPVLDPVAAQEVTGAPVLGRVTLPRGQGDEENLDAPGIGALCRRLLASPTSAILVVSPTGSSDLASRLTSMLAAQLRSSRPVIVRDGGAQLALAADPSGPNQVNERTNGSKSELLIVDGPTAAERLNRPDSALVMLVVPEGMGAKALRAAAEEYLDGGRVGLVLASTSGARLFERRHESRPASSVDESEDDDQPREDRLSIMIEDREGRERSADSADDVDGSWTPVGKPTRRS